MRHGIKVITDNQFDECVQFGIHVEVWMNQEKQDSGKIDSFTKDSFRINEGYFLRSNVLVTVSNKVIPFRKG